MMGQVRIGGRRQTWRAGRSLALGAVAALTLVACSSSSKSTSSPSTAAGPATTSSSPAATGTTAPGSAINCFFLIRSQDGKYIAPNNDASTCVNLPKLG